MASEHYLSITTAGPAVHRSAASVRAPGGAASLHHRSHQRWL